MPRPQEGYHHLDPEVIARNPPRFAELVHWTDTWGFEDNRGPVPWQDRESSNGGGGFVGGVAANRVLRERLKAEGERKGFDAVFPPPSLCTDNAVMIAAAGAQGLARGERDGLSVSAFSRVPVGEAPWRAEPA